MKLKSLIVLSSVLMYASTSLKAQSTEFYLNGFGRVVTSNNNLSGDAVTGSTPSKGVSGYSLFDLTPTIKVGNNLKVTSTLRVKNQFGGFFGNGNALSFRQFQIMGKIGKYVNYDLGDINIGEGMSEYSVNNFDDVFSSYESKVFTQRRQILQYENFNFGNKWRLQGAQARTKFAVSTLIDTLDVYGFVVRTTPSNEKDIQDRIMAGGRIGLYKNKMLSANFNYVGLLDVPVATVENVYKNNVYIADIKYLYEMDAVDLTAKVQTGISSYDFTTKDTSDADASFNDYFYDAKVNANVKGLRLNIFGAYKNVGPQYYNPASQTRRMDISSTPTLFDNIGGKSRTMTLFDSYTNEGQYNRTLSTTLSTFMPWYNNANPYGAATPNRTGFTAGVATDDSAQIINGELTYQMSKEIVGENTEELRSFNVLTSGLKLNVGTFLASEREYTLTFGYRGETTNRDGNAAVDLKSSLLDFGIGIELPKKIDLLFGYKSLSSKGNEFSSIRDNNNLVGNAVYQPIDIKQNILSVGANMRFSEASFLSVTYNRSVNTSGIIGNYNMNQLFINLTVSL